MTPVVCLCWLVMTVAALVSPFVLPASFTTHGKQRIKGSRYSVPKRWFSHFYIVAFTISIALFFVDRPSLSFSMHALRRLIEQVFLFPYPRDSKMHVLAYLLGLVFYPLVGLSFWTTERQQWNIFLWIAFLTLNVIQFSCHRQLSMLRAQGHYSVPEYLPFRFVLCPHYLCDILLYSIWAFSPGGICLQLCAVFSFISLTVNAIKQRQWYLSMSTAAYLPSAVIPFVI